MHTLIKWEYWLSVCNAVSATSLSVSCKPSKKSKPTWDGTHYSSTLVFWKLNTSTCVSSLCSRYKGFRHMWGHTCIRRILGPSFILSCLPNAPYNGHLRHSLFCGRVSLSLSVHSPLPLTKWLPVSWEGALAHCCLKILCRCIQIPMVYATIQKT